MAHRVDNLVDAETWRAPGHHDGAQAILAARRLVSPDDADIHIGALFVPSPRIAGPIFATIEDVLALRQLSSQSYADGRGLRCVKVGRAAWPARRLAHHPSGQIFALRVIACRPEPFLLLGLSAEPRHVHES